MEVVKLKKRDTSYLVPGAISDICSLKLECLDVWNKAAIAACHCLGSEGQSEYMKWICASTKSECLQFCEGAKV